MNRYSLSYKKLEQKEPTGFHVEVGRLHFSQAFLEKRLNGGVIYAMGR